MDDILGSLTGENTSLARSFASAIASFRKKFPAWDLSDLINDFQAILLQDSDRTENIDLEWLFWCLLNCLLDTRKFNASVVKESVQIADLDVQDVNLVEKYKILNVLNQYSALKMTTDEEVVRIVSRLPNMKWGNTKQNLVTGKSSFKSIDSDSIFRNDSCTLDASDSSNDELFFQLAYNLILANNFAELKEICDLSSNFEFWAIVQNYYSLTSTLKSFPLWRRTMFQLTKVTKNKWQKACYGLLCGDYESSSTGASSFEQLLHCHLNSMLQSGLESLLPPLESKMEAPPLVFTSVVDALDSIAMGTSNPSISQQSRHPVRILIGSLISNNSKSIIESTVQSIKTDSSMDESPYLLRILTNFAIVLHLKFGDAMVPTDDYIEILKIYSVRLLLNKLYYQIPIYISFIPQEELVEAYSNILSSFSSIEMVESSSIDEFKREHIKSMRNLQLPMEEIVRATMSKLFQNTEQEYQLDSEINLDYTCSDIDALLIDQLNWSIVANMPVDSILGAQTILRRFLITGKIGSCLKFLELINLPEIIQWGSAGLENDLPLLEIIQFRHLIILIEKITNLNNVENKLDLSSVLRMSNEIIKLTEGWLLNLIQTTTGEDSLFFVELRKLYLPTIINTNLDLLIKYRPLSDNLIRAQLAKVIISLANEKYKIWEIYDTQSLKLMLDTIADLSCELWGENSDGIFI